MGIYTGKVAPTMIRGRSVEVKDSVFIVPELTLGDREALEDGEVFEELSEAWEEAELNAHVKGQKLDREKSKAWRKANMKSARLMAKIAKVALEYNYPEITEEFIVDNFSMSQLGECYLGASGIKPGGEARLDAGEA
jgi:hypothetical protein